ncbi:LOW QUALITY PROTEIN: leucine-rich repeat-containing G-protein coupled receptor 5A-like [Trematomus bernacchii]|uniref:LOW QUALITY PROTEIN: leucine-rich repeat-containing G-protein coupled receptor 5A-like n=1 Tax=Trematomus bernacchii TaxID=40690 RepID=UPI00146E9437|nr:LOW QUALITY PROTEIN: leucine-rich repeat-containing G-protein coupled receptor 5A-like [Trematomus bernacchii]
MPGFVGLLAAFACLWAGMRSSGASVELRSSGEEGAVSGGCPARCRCSVDGLLHRADCSDLGLRETPGNLSVFTSYLDLSMNNLTALTSGALSNLHFLEELRLAGNDLSIIPRGAFSGLYNLKVLMLQNNQLTSVPAEAFNNLHNLQSLRLDANHISSIPSGCFSGLRSLRHLWLDDNSLTEVPAAALNELPALQAMTLALNHISHVPDHAFSKLGRLVVLHLNNNRIVSTGTNCFHGLHSLETLDLNYNSLVEFPTAIRSLGHLKELGFHSNNIQSIPEQAFIGNPSLITIFFYDNPIQSVGRSAFQDLPELRTLSLNGAADLTEFPDLTGTKSLESLTITGARITSLPSSVCEQLPNLQLLDLSYNQIQSLPSFSGCESVQKIDLHHNEIEELEENTFHGLMSLRSLDLSWNRLWSVKRNSFSALPALSKLDLSSNQLSALPLIGLQSLTHLRLAGNSELMELIQREELPRVRVMELPYAFQCCAFVSCERRGASWEKEEAVDSTGKETSVISSQVDQDWEDFLMEFEDEPKLQHTVHCSPAPGPFRPCLHLLGSWLVRLGVWLIAALSLVSNSLVVLSVFFSPVASVTPPKLLIGLLALVNGLMGVWSGWLAAVDAWTFGNFWRYGARWESSFLCRLSGFLCVFASQTGLFLLTVAALERCTAASSRNKPDGHNGRFSPPLTLRLSICSCFLFGLFVTLPPLVVGHSTSSLCLPLPSSSSSSSFSSLVFSVSLVLLDSLCFLLMTLAYTRLYCRPEKTPQTTTTTEEEEEEASFTRHVAWLLFSDCLLFLPVAFLSFSSLLRLPVADPEAVKALILLVAPLPSCVNPLLFLLFNVAARHDLAALLRLCRGRGRGGRRRTAAMLDSTYNDNDEDAEKQSCDSTQALVAVGGTREEEEEEEEETGRSEKRSEAFVIPLQ